MPRLILGSQSPRRKEIMSLFSIPFEQASPPFNEEAVPYKGDPIDYAITLSRGKADSLHRSYPHAIVLTADTIVYHAGKVYNKPKDRQEAVSFLSAYSGTWQSVYTAVTVRNGHAEYYGCEESRLLFNPLTPYQIDRFLDSITWHDKAGGFTVQGVGSLLIDKIDGCYYNITGLPVNTVRKLLLKAGVDLWHYVR